MSSTESSSSPSRRQFLKTSSAVSAAALTANFAAAPGIYAQVSTGNIYGTVKDGANHAVTALRMRANDQGNVHRAEGLTFSPAGNYATGVVSGTWSVGPDGDAVTARGYTGEAGTSLV